MTWNIRRGLITREHELKNILNDEDIDVAFITETDTKSLLKEENFISPLLLTISLMHFALP